MNDPDPIDRIRRLEARLAEIERRLGIAAGDPVAPPAPFDLPMASVASPAPAAPPREPIGSAAPEGRPVTTIRPPPLPARPNSGLPSAVAATVETPDGSPGADEDKSAVLAPPAPTPVAYAPVHPPTPVLGQGTLEQTIGLKWAGWIGAVILVIGLGLGIKFGYDQGWFGGVSDTVKLALCWVGSFALIAAGEIVYRRINRLSATGLFGAGVASLFLVSYAGHAYFDVYTRNVAFTLMTASTIAGALVAMRGRMVSIAVLALIGGNIAPILLSTPEPNLSAFFAYLLMLLGTALFLSWWGASPRWWTLRGLALVTTSLWTLVALLAATEQRAVDPRGWPVAWVLLFAGLFQLELIASGWSGARAGRKTGATFSLLVTAALAGGLMLIHVQSTDAVRAWWLLGVAGACAALGFAARAMQASMLQRSDSQSCAAALRALAVSYAAQSAVLLVVAVPVAFSGWAVMSGWAGLAIAFAILGVVLDLNVPRRAAAVTWALAGVYLGWWLQWHFDSEMSLVAFSLLQTPVPQFLLVAAGLSLVGHVVAAIVSMNHAPGTPARREFRVWTTLLHTAAGVLLVGSAIAALPPAGATLCILLYAWVCAIADAIRPGLRLAWHSAGVLAVGIVKWAVIDVVSLRLSPDWSADSHAVLLNPVSATGAALAVSMLGIWRLRQSALTPRDERRGPVAALALALGVLGIVTFGLSFEVDRAVNQLSDRATAPPAMTWSQVELLMLTMLWSLCAAAAVGLIRFIRGRSALASAGTVASVAGLLLLVKYVLVDTLGVRLFHPPAAVPVVGNLQVLAGVVLMGLIVLAWLLRPRGGAAIVGLAAALLPLWMATLEIDRWAASQATPWMARQAGWSVCWSAYAILLVVAGFRARSAALRYIGLSLFAITLLKVVLIDLSAASTGWRILSFFGLGALLLATSVIYGKISPKLLDASKD